MRRPAVNLLACGALVLTGCTVGGGDRTHVPDASPTIRIASFDFPESVLLAELYASALRAAGFDVTVDANLGSREIVLPALEQGFEDFVPEYLGSALQFAGLGSVPVTADTATERTSLARVLSPRGLVLLASAPAQNQNAVVVGANTAANLHLSSIGDLRPYAPTMVFGGPAECPERPLCLPGLERVYGLKFRSFEALDAAGDHTVSSLADRRIDVGLLFSTDGRIVRDGFVVLTDDRGLQPAENVTPLVRAGAVTTFGLRFVNLVDQISTRLTTQQLTLMNEEVTVEHQAVGLVVSRWLQEHGIGH